MAEKPSATLQSAAGVSGMIADRLSTRLSNSAFNQVNFRDFSDWEIEGGSSW
jgi:hypothetical protein